jgi:hypothetical protein
MKSQLIPFYNREHRVKEVTAMHNNKPSLVMRSPSIIIFLSSTAPLDLYNIVFLSRARMQTAARPHFLLSDIISWPAGRRKCEHG